MIVFVLMFEADIIIVSSSFLFRAIPAGALISFRTSRWILLRYVASLHLIMGSFHVWKGFRIRLFLL